jgi:hypothetical protein
LRQLQHTLRRICFSIDDPSVLPTSLVADQVIGTTRERVT